MTDNGYNDGELIDMIEVYTKLVKVVKMQSGAERTIKATDNKTE